MPITSRFRAHQCELFAPPAAQPKLPQEAYQRMLHLLAQMLNEHLEKNLCLNAQAEAGDE